MSLEISVIIPAHNPHAGRLRRTLAGLRTQTVPPAEWETIVIDNASSPAVDLAAFADAAPANTCVVREPLLGLTAARRRGFAEARGALLVLVDDDNVLAPDYLAQVQRLFAQYPRVGALGGRSLPEFEQAPPAWMREFDGLIACRDYGNQARISPGLRDAARGRNEYPAFAPIGAGMALRREAVEPWMSRKVDCALLDRRGDELTSGGDNDIVLTLMQHGREVGYFPELCLTHLIPRQRLRRGYLARLNHGIARSWVQVLAKHDACPWEAIPRWTVPLRKIKAWFVYRAWAGPAEYIRWRGACGHFEGRAAVYP